MEEMREWEKGFTKVKGVLKSHVEAYCLTTQLQKQNTVWKQLTYMAR